MSSDDPRSSPAIERVERAPGPSIDGGGIEALFATVRRAITRPLLPLVRPQSWNYRQHATRPLRIDPAYAREEPPANQPRIAIVTPSYNQGRFITATIDSVLTQNYPSLAYCVQDGASDDSTRDVLKSYGDRLSWHHEPDGGQANGINRGFARLGGDIMAYLNSDDVLLPGTLAYVARAFRDHPDVDVVYGHRIYIDQQGLEVGRCVLPPHHAQTLKWLDYVPQETMFWRRRVWDTIGPFDESFEFALDWDFILRAQAAGFRFMRLPRFLGCFRVHDRQKSTSLAHIGEREMLRLRRQHLGGTPTLLDMRRATTRYLLRQRLYELMYRSGVVRY